MRRTDRKEFLDQIGRVEGVLLHCRRRSGADEKLRERVVVGLNREEAVRQGTAGAKHLTDLLLVRLFHHSWLDRDTAHNRRRVAGELSFDHVTG